MSVTNQRERPMYLNKTHPDVSVKATVCMYLYIMLFHFKLELRLSENVSKGMRTEK